MQVSDAAKSYGFALNEDCSSRELKTPGGAVSKTFEVIAPILDADLIVDVCKLKTHCMMGLSAAVKNMFGVVPGLMKPELHCRFPEKAPFAEMLVDLCCGVRPHLCVVDAITAMEGNGPSGGNPRFVGALLSARDPFYLDVLCAGLVGHEDSRHSLFAGSAQPGPLPSRYRRLGNHRRKLPLLYRAGFCSAGIEDFQLY
ncbi:MAG: DUF362 domain-containing protein [Hydrogeniiclostridium mannosilyticum]